METSKYIHVHVYMGTVAMIGYEWNNAMFGGGEGEGGRGPQWGSKPGEGGEFRRAQQDWRGQGRMGEVLTISLVSTAQLLCVALEGADEDGQYASVPEHCLVLGIVADQLEECVQDPGHGLRVPIRRGGEGRRRGGEGRGGEGRGGEGRGGEGRGEEGRGEVF